MQICAIPNTQYPWWGCINIISNFVKGNSLLSISWKFLRKPVYLQSFLPIVVFLLISKSQGETITRLNLAISKLSISSSLDIFKTCQQMIIQKYWTPFDAIFKENKNQHYTSFLCWHFEDSQCLKFLTVRSQVSWLSQIHLEQQGGASD